MSILLESLNQQVDNSQDSRLPNVHSSHYDDEMLGDETLYRQVKLWRLISLALLFVILISWAYFIFQKDQKTMSSVEPAIAERNLAEKMVVKEQELIDVAEVAKNFKEQVSTTNESKEVPVSKKLYKPQKRQATIKLPPKQKAKPVEQKTVISNSAVISIDELPIDLQQKFPKIEVSSYVIADKAEDSFVILDGAFYQNNQVITPDLTLRKITSEHMVVEFHDYNVKIPLK